MASANLDQTQFVQTVPFATDEGLGTDARIGVIVLQSDQTIEHEFAQLFRKEGQKKGTALYHARIPNAMEVSPANLRDMKADLPVAAGLLAPSFGFDAIAYCCTSGATLIGEETVAELVTAIHPETKVTNPMSAAKAALTALDATRIALLTPYPASVTREMQENFQAAGFTMSAVASFDQNDDPTVARITPQSILDAVLQVGATDCDAVFVSCTSLRALGIIEQAEAQLGKPVIASNQALAWHLMHLTGLTAPNEAPGRIFKTLRRATS